MYRYITICNMKLDDNKTMVNFRPKMLPFKCKVNNYRTLATWQYAKLERFLMLKNASVFNIELSKVGVYITFRL